MALVLANIRFDDDRPLRTETDRKGPLSLPERARLRASRLTGAHAAYPMLSRALSSAP